MDSIFSAVRPGYLVIGAALVAGLYAMHGAGHHAPAPAPAPKAVAVAPVPVVVPPALAAEDTDDSDEAVDEATDEDATDEEMRGLDPIEDPAEFSMVFELDGTTYMRLSSEEQASSHGALKMISPSEDERAVIGTVAASAMPASLRGWMGRSVVVDGTCTARVVGFAEVSRVRGEPPGTEEYEYRYMDDNVDAEQAERGDPPEWTIDDVRQHGVMLAAKLDNCDGTWARASEYPAAAVAHETEEPALEQAAIDDVLATYGDDDDVDHWWKESGGEGDWRTSDSVAREAHTYVHPLTNEKWVVASVYREGGCGEFGVSRMAVFHVSDGGKLRRVADLGHAGQTIQDVVDLDGDGQPEILFGDGSEDTSLVDLKDQTADSISVDYVSYGCGC